MTGPAAELLTPAEVAAILRVSVKTLANWRYLGTGPDYVKFGQIRYSRVAVDAFISAHSEHLKEGQCEYTRQRPHR